MFFLEFGIEDAQHFVSSLFSFLAELKMGKEKMGGGGGLVFFAVFWGDCCRAAAAIEYFLSRVRYYHMYVVRDEDDERYFCFFFQLFLPGKSCASSSRRRLPILAVSDAKIMGSCWELFKRGVCVQSSKSISSFS